MEEFTGEIIPFVFVIVSLPEKVIPFVFVSLERQLGAGKLAARLARGCFWSFYVCFVLFGFGLLMGAFLVLTWDCGSLLIGGVVEEPLQMTEDLDFDYTKPSPHALVPVGSCNGGWVSGGKAGAWEHGGWRLVSPNHKLQLTISLTLPESDYNRKLGMFQVRAGFLLVDGNIMASSSQPCMLQFKSSSRLLNGDFSQKWYSTSRLFFRITVSQIKNDRFTEGTEPTACIRVILEQRAEFRPGSGIPEIYSASLKLESELPLFKKLIWNWRRTLYIWISMGLLIMELLSFLVRCGPIIVPRSGSVGGSQSRM